MSDNSGSSVGTGVGASMVRQPSFEYNQINIKTSPRYKQRPKSNIQMKGYSR